jgi:hypothetical protein
MEQSFSALADLCQTLRCGVSCCVTFEVCTIRVEHFTLAKGLQNGHSVTLLFASNHVKVDASGVASHQDEVPRFVLHMGWKASRQLVQTKDNHTAPL